MVLASRLNHDGDGYGPTALASVMGARSFEPDFSINFFRGLLFFPRFPDYENKSLSRAEVFLSVTSRAAPPCVTLDCLRKNIILEENMFTMLVWARYSRILGSCSFAMDRST